MQSGTVEKAQQDLFKEQLEFNEAQMGQKIQHIDKVC